MNCRGKFTTLTKEIPQLLIDMSKLVSKAVYVDKLKIDAVIDTGAGVSIISPGLVEKMNKLVFPYDGPAVSMANGNKSLPTGKIKLEIKFDSTVINIDALIMEISEIDLLLGNNALQQLGSINFNFNSELFTCKPNKEILTLPDSVPRKIVSLRSTESFTVPAFSVIKVSVKSTIGKALNTHTICEPSKQLMSDKGPSIGYLFVSSDTPIDNVLLKNFTSTTQWVNNGTSLATAESVE